MSFAATTESRLALRAATNGTCYHELVIGMEGLVVELAGAYLPPGELKNELEAEGRLALCEAAQSFAGQCRFATYAGRRMVRAMVGYLRTVDGGTQWRARRQQESRRQRQMLSKTIDGDASPEEIEWVYDAKEVEPIQTIQLSAAPELWIAPEVEDGAEGRFHSRWMRLGRTDRALVERAEQLGMASDGVSLTELARSVGERRSVVERRLGDVLSKLTWTA